MRLVGSKIYHRHMQSRDLSVDVLHTFTTRSVPGGSLAELIARQEKEGAERLSEDDLKQVLLQVAHGLRYIHSQHLVHLDIKPGQCYCIWRVGHIAEMGVFIINLHYSSSQVLPIIGGHRNSFGFIYSTLSCELV